MADELRKLVSLLRRKATIEAKKIKNDSSHWEGMCKGLYLGYEESASRLDKILYKYSSTESAQAAKYRACVEALKEAQKFIEDGSPLPTDKNHPYYKVSEVIDAALAGLEGQRGCVK